MSARAFRGVGDPYYPLMGNGGYDVRHYDVRFSFDPDPTRRRLDGTGDLVSPWDWREAWLNEGFATYSHWLWQEHDGGPTVQQQFDSVYARPATDPFWSRKVFDPGITSQFGAQIYVRGAMTLHALRAKVGDGVFLGTLRAWLRSHRFGTGSTTELIDLAERRSGMDLDAFFDVWVYRTEKPTSW